MKIVFKMIRLIPVFMLLVSCKKQKPDYTNDILSKMTIEDKIGQMLMFGFPGTEMTPEAESLLEKYRPGGIILFGFNIENKEQLRHLNSAIQFSAENSGLLPLFISTDQEGGKVRRLTDGVTMFPGNMAIGAANDAKLAYSVGKITGMELLTYGINMNLAPDVDINSNPDNPVINVRSFGSNRLIVSDMAAAYISGIQEAGCIAVAKHFPGHGDTSKDSHKTLPQIDHSMDYLRENELVPFRKSIESGVTGIMSAHIAFPQILGNDTPATLSPYFLTDILQNELGFKGIIMTDDLEMGAIGRNIDPGEAAVRAVNSGVDILLFSAFSMSLEKIHSALLAAYENGTISEERINFSAEKIIRAKLKFSIADYDRENSRVIFKEYIPSEKDLKYHLSAEKINSEITEKGVYYYDDGRKFAASNEQSVIVSGDRRISEYINNPEILYADKNRLMSVIEKSPDNEKIIYYFPRNYEDPILHELMRLGKSGKKIDIRIVYTGNPYDITGRGELPPVLFTFGTTPEVYRAVLKFIDGRAIPGKNGDLDLGFDRKK